MMLIGSVNCSTQHIFCQIDEAPFAKLYDEQNGRPNFPVNILLSLEILAAFRDHTVEEMRMDSTMLMPNIRKAGKLSLAYDVLVAALKVIPPRLLTEELIDMGLDLLSSILIGVLGLLAAYALY